MENINLLKAFDEAIVLLSKITKVKALLKELQVDIPVQLERREKQLNRKTKDLVQNISFLLKNQGLLETDEMIRMLLLRHVLTQKMVENKWTYKEAGERIGVNPQAIQRFLEHCTPVCQEDFEKICEFVGVQKESGLRQIRLQG